MPATQISVQPWPSAISTVMATSTWPSVSLAMNRDGYADLSIGVPGEGYAMHGNTGAVHILFGGARGALRRQVHVYSTGSV